MGVFRVCKFVSVYCVCVRFICKWYAYVRGGVIGVYVYKSNETSDPI